MSTRVSGPSSEGVNLAPLREAPLPDMHCPKLPQEGNNFWSDSCRWKQLGEEGACRRKLCPTGYAITGRRIPEPEEAPKCKCGKDAMKQWELNRYRLTDLICRACWHENKRKVREAVAKSRARALAEKIAEDERKLAEIRKKVGMR